MDLVLTGRQMKADEAERAGLVSRVVPTEEALAVAKEAAATIASKSLISVYLAKEAVNRAFDTTLTEGCARRAVAVLLAVRHRRPDGGDGGVRREAGA